MHRTFEIYPEWKLIVVRFTGQIDYQDALIWFDEAPQHEAFSKEFDGIVDLREAIFKQPRPERARSLASYMIEQDFTNGRWVVLVSKPMETALMLLYGKVASRQHPIEVFSTVEAAADFLNIDLEAIDVGFRE